MRLQIATLLVVGIASMVSAQQPTSPRRTVVVEERAAADSDVVTIDGVMRAFYDVISGRRGSRASGLHWDGARWWITSVSWDSERPGNKAPTTVAALCRESTP